MTLKTANQTAGTRIPVMSKPVKRLAAEESDQSPGKHDENSNANSKAANVISPLKKLKLKLSPDKKSEVSSTASDQSPLRYEPNAVKDIDPPAFVGTVPNDDEDVMLEIDGVRPLKMGSKILGYDMDWMKRSRGKMRLLKHKETGRSRLVHRGFLGKVAMNIHIPSIFMLHKVKVKSKRAKGGTRVIRFYGVVLPRKKEQEENGGANVEIVTLKIRDQSQVDTLYDKLIELGAEPAAKTEV